jgi:hypothetical protein
VTPQNRGAFVGRVIFVAPVDDGSKYGKKVMSLAGKPVFMAGWIILVAPAGNHPVPFQ